MHMWPTKLEQWHRALACIAIWSFSVSAVSEDDLRPCDLPLWGTSRFSRAVFLDEKDDLIGNAFSVDALPPVACAEIGTSGKRECKWTLTMVTAAHVLIDVCDGYESKDFKEKAIVLYSGLQFDEQHPRNDPSQWAYQRAESSKSPITQAWCKANAEANPNAPDIGVFEQVWALPQDVVPVPLVVAPFYGAAPNIRNFEHESPIIWGFRAPNDETEQNGAVRFGKAILRKSSLGVYQIDAEGNESTRTGSNYTIVGPPTFEGQSGSAVVLKSAQYTIVIGVLTQTASILVCSQFLENNGLNDNSESSDQDLDTQYHKCEVNSKFRRYVQDKANRSTIVPIWRIIDVRNPPKPSSRFNLLRQPILDLILEGSSIQVVNEDEDQRFNAIKEKIRNLIATLSYTDRLIIRRQLKKNQMYFFNGLMCPSRDPEINGS
jgi:hypothetical protein